MNPLTPGDVTDAPLLIGRTFSDEIRGVHVTPVEKNAQDGSVKLWVNFTEATNQAPSIDWLKVNNQEVTSGATVEVNAPALVDFEADASDAISDTLDYNWEFEDEDGRYFFASGSASSKPWSVPGHYRVRLTVSDRKGGVVSRSLIIRVGNSRENIISGRLVDPVGSPISNALVRHRDWYAFSDTDGSYALTVPDEPDPTPNPHSLTVAKAGWTFTAPAFAGVGAPVILPGPVTVADFRGAYRGYDISGTVRNATGTQVVRGVIVDDQTAMPGGGTRTEVVDASGQFTLATKPGRYTLKFMPPGGTPTTRLVTVDYGNVALGEVRIATDSTPFDAGTAAPTNLDAVPAAQLPNATGVWLSGSAADDKGEQRLKYRWERAPVANNAPAGGDVTFPSGDALDRRSAKRILAVFNKAGTYILRMTAVDEQGNRPFKDVSVTVGSSLTYASVTGSYLSAVTGPTTTPYATIPAGTSQKFDAAAVDQFGVALATQPAITWAVQRSPGGSVDSTGLYRAASLPGTRESIVASVAGTSVAGSATSHVVAPATVVGRHIFYNRSKWDGSTLTVPDGPDDGLAIAEGKSALLPGQEADFNNYTSYSRGINGLMIDLQGIVDYRVLNVDDFILKVGNTADPTTWALAPTPVITMEWGGGGNSDRVKFVWPDNVIQNQWLQVTIKTTADTGLASPDVFYFGNLKGDTTETATGSSATLADDYSRTKAAVDANPGGAALITSLFDHNRDGFLTSADYSVVQQNFFASLYLFTSAPV